MNNFKYIDGSTTVFWFRRDLRLEDNAGLYFALKTENNVLPVFIFDTEILDQLEDKQDMRVEFIHQSVTKLKMQLEELGSTLAVFHGNPVEIFEWLRPKALYTNNDYEPYARKRDETVSRNLAKAGIEFKSFKDQVIFEKNEVIKDDGTPYTIFTPYSRKWKAKLNSFFLKSYPVEKYMGNLKKVDREPMPALEQLGFKRTGKVFPEKKIHDTTIKHYNETRDFPAISGTSKLSVHLRFGTISIRELASDAGAINETYLNELIWRDFYHMILWHFPNVEQSFKSAYDFIQWRNDEREFDAWCNGKTGYPIVDAGMRELNETGYMHNRVRMIVASFLTKHLLIDWRWGEAYFAKKLLDFDLAANNGGWQWASGSGCDAAPYFRVFNPTLQAEKFDPESKYIKTWIPELGTNAYPKPIVDHNFARDRALATYQDALKTV